jgi:hypothetical protein
MDPSDRREAGPRDPPSAGGKIAMTNPVRAPGSGSDVRLGVTLGVILILVGVVSYLGRFVEIPAELGVWIVALVGAVLLAAFAYTRQYGFLIPGGIVTGLGLGLGVSQTLALHDEAEGGLIVLGLGLGFLSIYAIGALARAPENHWWPFIPGGILSVVGSALIVGGQAVDVLDYWGIAAIVLGLLVFWGALRGQHRPG